MTDEIDAVLCLKIKDKIYVLESIVPESAGAISAWRLTSSEGETYVVNEGRHGYGCECGDYVWRKDGTAELCKHIQALIKVGLL